MKSKLTTTLALVGVLTAGTAAAAVNTQALQSRAESTIGAGTTTLVTPAEASPIAVAPATAVIPLDTTVSNPDPAQSATDPNQSVGAKSTSQNVSTASVAPDSNVIYSNPNPTSGDDEGDDDEFEGEDDD